MIELSAIFGFIIGLVILSGLWAWGLALKKWLAGRPLLEYEPRRPARWSPLEIFLTVAIMLTLQGLAIELAGTSAGRAEDAPADLAGAGRNHILGGLASLVACALGGLLIVARTGSSWGQDLGLTLRQAGRDIAYGVVAYVMLAPIIGVMQAVLQHWYPSEHPLIESFRENPTLEFFLICVFTAALVAPLVEEFLCRVLLQGWLERAFVATSMKDALFPGLSLADEVASHEDGAHVHAAGQGPAAEGATLGAEPPVEDPVEQRRPGPGPIVISALLFAGLHWGHGPDPIPLFVLALGLGYLYQRTHRILPCVVLHFLVNAFSLALLGLSLTE